MTDEALVRRARLLVEIYLKADTIAQNTCDAFEGASNRTLGPARYTEQLRGDVVRSVAHEGNQQSIAKAVYSVLAAPVPMLRVSPEALGRVISEVSEQLEPWILIPLRQHIVVQCRAGSKLKPVRSGLKAALHRIRVLRHDLHSK